jgi:three-Cys-motif partner protein
MGQPTEPLWNSEPRTLLKHQIYRQYLHCWMGKICQSFRTSTVVDAFAGPGSYLDGPDGSPVVIAKTFTEHSRRPRFKLLRLICLEKRPDRRDLLATRIAGLPRVPRLDVQICPAAGLLDCFPDVRAAAHGRDSGTPVLWILDPFDYSSVPFQLVKACLAAPRDELLVTWFADELYRFCGDPGKEHAIDQHFGTPVWRRARRVAGESARKEELLRVYRESLESVGEVHTGAFSIASKNETARYSLVFATHSDAGMGCFNDMKWRMDPYSGHHVSEKRSLGQLGLFDETPVLGPLRTWLESRAGQALTFEQLARHAGRLGFRETHLRTELSNMAADGLAVREEPLDYTRTPWPAGCMIRFYAPPSAAPDSATG